MPLGTSNNKLTQLLPLRKGITVTFNDYDKDNKPHWMLHDPGRNKFYIIGWQEYEILNRWHLEKPELIVSAINAETTLEIELSDVISFFSFLKQHYLLQQSGYEIHKIAAEQKLFKDDNKISWLIGHYLFFKIPLVHPDHFLTKTKKIADVVFSRYTLYLMTALAVIAVYQLSTQWDEFIHSFPTILSWKGLFFYFIAFTGTKLIHELGHAYMCKRYGVPVPSLGVAFLVFWPVLYTDTTLSWRLNSKQRLRISMAGIWAETYVVIIAALFWSTTHNTTLQTICFLIISINWIASILINISPFMRFDGYFILSDLLHMPNLQPRAFALTRWQLRRWLFNWPDPPPEKYSKRLHYFLVIYSLITWIYRLGLYLGIALLVYHFIFKIIGIILFLIEINYFVLAPFISEARYFYTYKDKFTFNKHTIYTMSIAGFAFLIFILPLKQSIELPATLSYSHEFIYAPDNGILLNKLPAAGTQVKNGDAIATLVSPELNHAMQLLILQYNQKLGELRRSAINQKYVSEKNILLSDIRSQQSEYRKLYLQNQKLHIKAPFDGIIIEASTHLNPGEVIKKGEWLGDIINLKSTEIEGFAAQIDIGKVHVGSSGVFYPHDFGESKIAVEVNSIEHLNTPQLNCFYSSDIEKNKNQEIAVDTPCYHASDFGGDIPTYITDQGSLVPTKSVYRVILVPKKSVQIPFVETGVVILNTQRSSYLSRSIYYLKKILIQESDL